MNVYRFAKCKRIQSDSAIVKRSVSCFFLFKVLAVLNGFVPSWMVDGHLSSKLGVTSFSVKLKFQPST